MFNGTCLSATRSGEYIHEWMHKCINEYIALPNIGIEVKVYKKYKHCNFMSKRWIRLLIAPFGQIGKICGFHVLNSAILAQVLLTYREKADKTIMWWLTVFI